MIMSAGSSLRRLSRTAGPLVVCIVESRVLGLSALLAAAVLTLPLASFPLAAGGEFEYQAAMTVAFREHLQWGSQAVWTYGPYGYMNVLDYMDFSSWALALAVNLAAHAALFGILALFLMRIGARPWQWLLIAAVVLVFFDRYQGFEVERFPVLDHKSALVAVLLLYLAAETSSQRLAALFACGAGLVIGYLLLDKGTFVLIGGALVAAYFGLSLARGLAGSVAALMAGLAASYLGLWLLAGQAITGIPSYFRSVFEMIAGYTSAMSWEFSEAPAAHGRLQLVLTIVMLALVGLSLVVTLWRGDRSLFGLLLLSSPLILFAFKNSFVRFDEPHALTFWSLLGVVQGLVLVRTMASTHNARRRAPAVLAGAIILASAVLVGGLGAAIGRTPYVFVPPSLTFPNNLASYGHAADLVQLPELRIQEQRRVRDGLLAAYPLPPNLVDELRQGNVDIVPWDAQLAFAYGFDWDPQPVLLSYGAYRPYLDHLDAQHYIGPRAPRFVLFVAQDIDGRYPLFSEPETYRVLLDRYKVRQRISDLLVLERRPDAPIAAMRQLGSVAGRIGDWIEIPPHGDQRLYGRVQVGYTPLGQALIVLDHPPELHIRIKYGGGQVSSLYRFVPAVGPDGLDLSSYAPDSVHVADLAQGRFELPIESIQVVADTPNDAYEHAVRIAFFTTSAA